MTSPMCIGRSNAVADVADRAIHCYGFGRDDDAPLKAARAYDFTAYEYAHVVVGFAKRPPASLTTHPELRTHKGEQTTWIGGTLSAFARAMDVPDMPQDVKAGIAALLARHATSYPVFGNPRFLPEPSKDLVFPTERTPDCAAAWGGIIATSLDAETEQRLVSHGARVLGRATAGDAAPRWRVATPKRGRAARTAERPVVLSTPLDKLSARDRKLVEEFLGVYARMQTGLEDRAVANDLRVSCEGTEILLAVDDGTLVAAAANAPERVQRTIERLRELILAAQVPAEANAEDALPPAKTGKTGRAA